MPTSHQPPPPADPNRPARGRNRVDPVQLDQLHAAVDHAGQGPYPAGSLLPPHPNPGDRWPLLGAPLSARAWQVGLWLTAPTHTGRGALPVLARREVARFLDEQGLAPALIPQDVMRILASLAREPGGRRRAAARRHARRHAARDEERPTLCRPARRQRGRRLARQPRQDAARDQGGRDARAVGPLRIAGGDARPRALAGGSDQPVAAAPSLCAGQRTT